MKAAAALLLALLALAFAAESHAAFCRQSAYKLPCKTVDSAKKAIFKACKLTVTIGKPKQYKNGCCTYPQKVADAATWDKFKVCEEASTQYKNILKKKKSLCSALQSSKIC